MIEIICEYKSFRTWAASTFPLLHLRHNSISNPSLALPTSQLILQPFHCFTYVTAHSPTLLLLHLLYITAHSPLPLLHLCHSSFSNTSIALPMSQLILQPFCCFTYVTVHSPTLLSLLLRHKPPMHNKKKMMMVISHDMIFQ